MTSLLVTPAGATSYGPDHGQPVWPGRCPTSVFAPKQAAGSFWGSSPREGLAESNWGVFAGAVAFTGCNCNYIRMAGLLDAGSKIAAAAAAAAAAAVTGGV